MRKIVGLIFVAGLIAAGWFAWALYSPVTPITQTFVLLHPGYSTRRIAAELKGAGIIRSEEAFVFWHYVHRHRSLKAGEYVFDQSANLVDVQRRLIHGDVYLRTVVVPEGYTMFDIARSVEAAGLGPAQDFLKEAQSDTALVADIAPNANSLEGYLFPETYEFTRLMTMHDMAAAMVKQFRQVARQVGLIPTSASMSPIGLSRASARNNAGRNNARQINADLRTQTNASGESVGNQAANNAAANDVQTTIIMASIVEKETAAPEERALVASVYYNRLLKKIALDADPSIIYAELLAGTYTGALHHADMQFPSPYNTYRNAGLPPGPIGNPGRSSIEAAMHPAQSDYFYFVADAAGHHRFARTMEEHNKNVDAYRKAMRAH